MDEAANSSVQFAEPEPLEMKLFWEAVGSHFGSTAPRLRSCNINVLQFSAFCTLYSTVYKKLTTFKNYFLLYNFYVTVLGVPFCMSQNVKIFKLYFVYHLF